MKRDLIADVRRALATPPDSSVPSIALPDQPLQVDLKSEPGPYVWEMRVERNDAGDIERVFHTPIRKADIA